VQLRFCLIFLCSGTLIAPARADDWPAWRGAYNDGVAREKSSFPLSWSADENITWMTEIPGIGHSSPIVWANRVFLTTCIEATGQRQLLSFDRNTGKILWRQTVVTARLEKKHRLNSHASSTPATDGTLVFVTFLDTPKIVVAAYDFAGREIWRRSPGGFNSPHGFCSSPILDQNLVIVNCDQDDQEAFLVALDKSTGAEVWRADRPNRTRSYCVPIIVEAAGKKQMVLTGSKCVAGYDPANGKQHWIVRGPTEQFVASAVFVDGLFIITGGFPDHHILAIRPDGSGDVTDSHVLWRTTRNTSYVPSPIAHRGLFFIVSDDGIASCYEPKTGKMYWNERLSKHVSASLVAAGDYIYVLDDSGTTFVLKADRKFEVVAKNSLKEECYASPALSDRQVFIRGVKHLYCIGNK
jgi:outer membrane protein assembly factor BamB